MATKYLVYKVAKFNDERHKKKLQDLVTKALKKRKAATSRSQKTDTNGYLRLVNYHGPFRGCRVGEMFDYTVGARQASATIDQEADALNIQTVSAGEKSEFLHSIMYFLIKGNSVIMSQSMSLKSLQFEGYLNWLLHSSDLLDEEDFVILRDQIPKENKATISDAKKFTFHSPVTLDATPLGIATASSGEESEQEIDEPVKKTLPAKVAPAAATKDTKMIRFTPGGNAWDTLKTLFPQIHWPAKFDSSEIIKDRSLEVQVSLSWSKVMQDDPTDLFDDIANQIRHVDEELDFSIETKAGTITRDEIKLRKSVSVPTDTYGLIKKDLMWVKMSDWLASLAKSNRIVADK